MRTVLLAGGTGRGQGGPRAAAGAAARRAERGGQRGRRHGVAGPARQPGPGHHPLHARRPGGSESRAGAWRATRRPPWACWSATARRPGSASATPTWPRTSIAQQLMRDGASLTDATAALSAALGVPSRLLPATDDPVRTVVETAAGDLAFQAYFVERRQQDEVTGAALRGGRCGAAEPGGARGHRAGRAGGDRAVKPAGQHRSHPGHPGHACGSRARDGCADRGLRDRGRQGDPRTGGPDAGLAGPRADSPGSGADVSRPARPLRDRRGGRGARSGDRRRWAWRSACCQP